MAPHNGFGKVPPEWVRDRKGRRMEGKSDRNHLGFYIYK